MKTWLNILIGISLLSAGIGIWLWLNRQRDQSTPLQPTTSRDDMLSLIGQLAGNSGSTMVIASPHGQEIQNILRAQLTTDEIDQSESGTLGAALKATRGLGLKTSFLNQVGVAHNRLFQHDFFTRYNATHDQYRLRVKAYNINGDELLGVRVVVVDDNFCRVQYDDETALVTGDFEFSTNLN